MAGYTGTSMTYRPGAEPGYEVREDLRDSVSMIAPDETPLLDYLGDPIAPAGSSHLEWLDDENDEPNTLSTASATSAATAVGVTAGEEDQFLAGDEVIVQSISTVASASLYTKERLLITGTTTNTLQFSRGYGGSTAATIPSGAQLKCVGRAALEGADARDDYSRLRDRRENWSQIFDGTVKVSGTKEAVDNVGVVSELDYQKSKRLKVLLGLLESSVINGDVPASTPQGSASVRRTMRGLLDFITGNVIDGSAATSGITEALLRQLIRTIWDNGGNVDVLIMNGYQMSRAADWISKSSDMDENRYIKMIRQVMTEFGIQNLLLSRRIPYANVLALDSTKIGVVPLKGRNFFFEMLGKTGDSVKGQVVGEYSLIVRNPDRAHGQITGLGFIR